MNRDTNWATLTTAFMTRRLPVVSRTGRTEYQLLLTKASDRGRNFKLKAVTDELNWQFVSSSSVGATVECRACRKSSYTLYAWSVLTLTPRTMGQFACWHSLSLRPKLNLKTHFRSSLHSESNQSHWVQTSNPSNHVFLLRLVAWHSGRMSVSDRQTSAVLRSTCGWWVTTYVGKPVRRRSANLANLAFHLFGVDKWLVGCD